MNKLKLETLQDKISRFLFAYRNIPQSTTDMSPAELLLGRWDLWICSNQICNKEWKMSNHGRRMHMINIPDCVLSSQETLCMLRFFNKHQWLPGHITDCTGLLSYIILDDGRSMSSHWSYLPKNW